GSPVREMIKHNASRQNRMDDKITQSIRNSYDRVADEYARRFFNELQNKTLDRELLCRFAKRVAYRGEVCDMGCGPGHITRYLREAGASVFGLDLSPRMLEEARGLNAGIRFSEGNMAALELSDGELAGVVGFYAIVNIPKDSLPLVFGEMKRVLQPGGLLLLAFHVGNEVLHKEELWDRPVSVDFFLFPTLQIRRCLDAVGAVVEEGIEHEPFGPGVQYQRSRAYMFQRKPASPESQAGSRSMATAPPAEQSAAMEYIKQQGGHRDDFAIMGDACG